MAQVQGVFKEELQKSITDSKILMVGAGGIGCELLKNIVLTGTYNSWKANLLKAIHYYYLS